MDESVVAPRQVPAPSDDAIRVLLMILSNPRVEVGGPITQAAALGKSVGELQEWAQARAEEIKHWAPPERAGG